MFAFEAGVKTQRAYWRQPVRLTAHFTNSSGLNRSGEIFDVSVSGLFLCPASDAVADIRPGTWIRVYLTIPNRAKPLQISGEVRWTGRSPVHQCDGFGIAFDWLNPELQDLDVG